MSTRRKSLIAHRDSLLSLLDRAVVHFDLAVEKLQPHYEVFLDQPPSRWRPIPMEVAVFAKVIGNNVFYFDNELYEEVLHEVPDGVAAPTIRLLHEIRSWLDDTEDVVHGLGYGTRDEHILEGRTKYPLLCKTLLLQWLDYLETEARRLRDCISQVLDPTSASIIHPKSRLTLRGSGKPIDVKGMPTVTATQKEHDVLHELVKHYPMVGGWFVSFARVVAARASPRTWPGYGCASPRTSRSRSEDGS